LSQLKYILGQEPERFHFAYEYFVWYVTHPEETTYNKPASILIGIVCSAWLYFFKWFKAKYPPNPARSARLAYRLTLKTGEFSTLIMIVAASAVAYALRSDGVNVKVIGAIPSGMRAPQVPNFTAQDFNKCVLNCLVLAILSYMESFAIGTKFADIAGYRLDNSQEMLAIGASNVVGSFFNGYLSAGSFSRTAVNAKAGSQSPMSCIVTAVLVLAGLYVTEIFYYIPFAALAAIIETSIVNIIDFGAMRHAWKVSKPDFLMMFVSFIITIFLGMEMGIIVGVVLSILLLVKATATPHYAVLGKVLIDPMSVTESEQKLNLCKETLREKRLEFLATNESLGVDREHSLGNYERALSTDPADHSAYEALPPRLKELCDLMEQVRVRMSRERGEGEVRQG
jgi:SulP family sulfate permease